MLPTDPDLSYDPMAVSDPRIFVVASADEAQGITLLLMQAGFTKIRSGDGGDETLGEILGDPPDVVVLRASLEHGDALSLSNTLRTALDRPRPVVLIGDDQGPIRTALDALDYAAERFLRWPVHPNALAYSIRSVQGGAAEGAQATGGLAEGLVSAGLAEASDGEIAAISAGLAEIAASSATSAIDQQPWEADRQQPWEADRQQPWEADRQHP
ncbi:MAG: response regulator transcription factor, partial [Deltaproteobacteria bacterium]|nr:response regulator transcription factor [Deltaproteobacteria bacterium]